MSDYPPAPQLGTRDHPNYYHHTPSAQAYNTEMSQYRYQSRAQSSYTNAHTQGLSNSINPPPHANAYSFHANAQAPFESGVNGTSAEHNHQAHPHTLSLHPSPHAPTPFDPLYFSQVSVQAPANPNIPPSHIQPLLKQRSHQASVREQSPEQKGLESIVPCESDLEDGEVDDQEIDKSSNLSELNDMGVNFSRSLRQSENEKNNLAVEDSSNGYHSLDKEHSANSVRDSCLHSENLPPTSSQSLQPPLSKGSLNIPKDFLTPQSNKNTLDPILPANGKEIGHSLTNTQLLVSKSEEAKQALQDLISHGLDFAQLVNHGMNSDILRMLFAEAGRLVTTTPSSSSSKPQQVAKSGTSVEAAITPEEGQCRGPSPITSTRHNTHSLEKGPSVFKSNSSPIQAIKEGKKPLVAPITAGTPKKADNPLSKAPGSKATDTKPLDRKEYIARMLAAKAGKSAITAKSPVPSDAPSVTASEVVARPLPSSAAPTSSVPAVDLKAQRFDQRPQRGFSGALPQPLKDETDAEAKRKFQTDLARQKMEALKLQQETRKATNNISTHQTSLTSSGSISQVPVVAPVTVPQLPASSRQSSYFSPVSQKTPFSIPGLFMTNEPSHTLHPSVEESSQASAAPQQPPPIAAAAPIKEASIETKHKAELSSPATSNPAQRKRQKAADFLDSPSTRVKRPLGQQEDSNVIIDISDDEMADASDAGSIDLETSDNRVTTSNKLQSDDFGTGRQKPLQDLPPLNDFSSRRKTPAVTPPTAPVSIQAKGLRTKEMEIESMNRKIAELEQRINAKKTTSRAHTPGLSGTATVSPPPGLPSLDDGDMSKTIEESPAETRHNSSDSRSGQGVQIAMEKADTLAAKQKLHEVEVAKAETERSLAVDIAIASDAESVLQRQQSQSIQVEWESALREQVQSSEYPQLCEVEHRKALDEQPPPNDKSHIQEREKTHMSTTKDSGLQGGEQPMVSYEQQRQRRLAIESGLPILDATVEKTKQKLESLRKEIEDLELEVQKGVDGRKALIEELKNLSATSEAQPSLNEHEVQIMGPSIEQSSIRDASTELGTAPSLIEVMDDSPPPRPKSPEVARALQEQIANPHDITQTSIPSSLVADEHPSNEDLEEDTMDISRSELDEGECSNYSPKLSKTKNQQAVGSDEDEESYEPPSDISVLQQHQLDQTARQSPSNSQKSGNPARTNFETDTNKQEVVLAKSGEGLTLDVDSQGEERNFERSPSLADASDPDDYEPPEPAALISEPVLHPQLTKANSEIYSRISEDVNDNVAGRISDSLPVLNQVSTGVNPMEPELEVMPALGSSPNLQHFTPYESPLKQFKSFRNHPDYLNEVSHGFRSLTYSHSVKPDIPVCRYELDGVCNDASCDSQHFKNMGLSDEKILVDLGTLPRRSDITALDATAYTDGLRKLIQDIRTRKVRDVNEVASEIAAYRRQFLGDFRILSL